MLGLVSTDNTDTRIHYRKNKEFPNYLFQTSECTLGVSLYLILREDSLSDVHKFRRCTWMASCFNLCAFGPKSAVKTGIREIPRNTFEKHGGKLRWQKDFKMFHTTPFPFGLIWLLSVQTVVKQGLSVLTENVRWHFFNVTSAIEKKKRYQVEIMLLKQLPNAHLQENIIRS